MLRPVRKLCGLLAFKVRDKRYVWQNNGLLLGCIRLGQILLVLSAKQNLLCSNGLVTVEIVGFVSVIRARSNGRRRCYH